MKILVAVDDAEHAEYILQDVLKFEWPADVQFKVVHVFDDSFLQSSGSELAERSAQIIIDSAVEKLKTKFAAQHISAQVLKGYPKIEIVNCAEYWPADLIVMSSRGRRGLKRILLGSVSHSVLVASKCSVRISRLVEGANKSAAQKILVGFDESPVSETIIERIACRPWRNGTEFVCITAVPTLMQNFYGVQDVHEIDAIEIAQKEKLKNAKKNLEKIAETMKSRIPNTVISCEVLEGDPREILVDRAKDIGADLIVVGHKGKNWMDRLLIGSVSEAVATWASCSVAVVK